MANQDSSWSIEPLSKVMHEFAVVRSDIRALNDQINISLRDPDRTDIDRLRANSARLVERLDWLDVLFEFLRIELNPEGISYAPRAEYNIHGIFFRAVRHLSTRVAEKQLKIFLSPETGFLVEGYPSLPLLPMLLLDNAVKYSPVYGQISVLLDSVRSLVTVESLGPEIDSVELSTIFNKGVRGKNAQLTPRGGQGLGLYIAKEICRAHNIVITVSQQPKTTLNKISYAEVKFSMKFESSQD